MQFVQFLGAPFAVAFPLSARHTYPHTCAIADAERFTDANTGGQPQSECFADADPSRIAYTDARSRRYRAGLL